MSPHPEDWLYVTDLTVVIHSDISALLAQRSSYEVSNSLDRLYLVLYQNHLRKSLVNHKSHMLNLMHR